MDWFLIGAIFGSLWIVGFCSYAGFEFGKWWSRRKLFQEWQNGNMSDGQYTHLYHKLLRG